MNDVEANYIAKTAPELQGAFTETLQKILHFSRLSQEHLDQLFQYSKFIVLEDGERPVKEGTFGQNVYLLVQGRLEVYLTNENGVEEYVDVIYTPFRIFGEQCILGEPNNTSIEARGEVLLLGIDISGLPDLLDGIENPENRLEDSAYIQSRVMYMIFADVLNRRLGRLIKDQYKLFQKLVNLHQSRAYQDSWNQSILLTVIFNEFSQNQLSPNLDVREALNSTLELYLSQNGDLKGLLSQQTINTQQVYLELVKLDALGELESMSSLLMEIVQKLTIEALELEEYTKQTQMEAHDLPAMMSLADYLNALFEEISNSGILGKELSRKDFLDSFLNKTNPDPFALEVFLSGGGWVTSVFDMAHLMFLICRNCISHEFELNQIIGSCVRYLTRISIPRQNTQTSKLSDQEKSRAVVEEMIELHSICSGGDEKAVKARPASGTSKGDVDDLLAEFGL